MKTTRHLIGPIDYLGIDLSDRYANCRRPNDVCGLTSTESNKLSAKFWLWEWPEPDVRLDVSEVANEIRAAKSTMIDGPQALASTGNSLRGCERACGAAGKTPDVVPSLGKPFAGFVRSSVELFGAFAAAEFLVSPSRFMGGISEVYPGDFWHRLVGRSIPKKSTPAGSCGTSGVGYQRMTKASRIKGKRSFTILRHILMPHTRLATDLLRLVKARRIGGRKTLSSDEPTIRFQIAAVIVFLAGVDKTLSISLELLYLAGNVKWKRARPSGSGLAIKHFHFAPRPVCRVHLPLLTALPGKPRSRGADNHASFTHDPAMTLHSSIALSFCSRNPAVIACPSLREFA